MLTTEVAGLTASQHRNVLVNTRKMLIELHGEGGLLSFQQNYRNEQKGQEYPCYRLSKRELMVPVTSYSVAMRAHLAGVSSVRDNPLRRPPGS